MIAWPVSRAYPACAPTKAGARSAVVRTLPEANQRDCGCGRDSFRSCRPPVLSTRRPRQRSKTEAGPVGIVVHGKWRRACESLTQVQDGTLREHPSVLSLRGAAQFQLSAEGARLRDVIHRGGNFGVGFRRSARSESVELTPG